jgi:hypothetical protein
VNGLFGCGWPIMVPFVPITTWLGLVAFGCKHLGISQHGSLGSVTKLQYAGNAG